MSLTRTMLKGMGLTEEQISTIIEAHTDTTEALKAQRDEFKASADKLPAVQKELDELKAAGDGGWQEKFTKEHADFEAYKNEVAAKETRTAKQTAYRALLKAAGVSDNRLDAVLKVTDLSKLELSKDGTIKDADKLTDEVKTEWADFIVQTQTQGANTSNPPANNGGSTATKESIMAIKDATERQKAIAENIHLFQNNK